MRGRLVYKLQLKTQPSIKQVVPDYQAGGEHFLSLAYSVCYTSVAPAEDPTNRNARELIPDRAVRLPLIG